MNKRTWGIYLSLLMLVVGVYLFSSPDLALAGLGGQFSKLAVKSPFGKYLGIIFGLLMLIAVVILLPLIWFILYKEWRGSRQALADLQELSMTHPHFSWNQIEAQVQKTVELLHLLWSRGDIGRAAHLMVPRYFNSQQELLDLWRREGKRNVLELRRIRKIIPLYVDTGCETEPPHVSVLVKLVVLDYLERIDTKELLKGSLEEETVRQLWRMEYEGGSWKLGAIESDDDSLKLAMQANRIETAHLRGGSGRGVAMQPQGYAKPVDTRVEQEETQEID